MNAQKLSKVLVFMIQAGLDLFEVPPTLATDIRAYWADKNRKILSEKTGVRTFIILFSWDSNFFKNMFKDFDLQVFLPRQRISLL